MRSVTNKKIIVIGCPGSGKSVFSRKLAAALDLPLIHLDAIYHQDIWPEEADQKREQWKKHVRRLVEQDQWIIDGNYKGSFDIRMAAADTIIFLDYPRWLTMVRMFKRRIEHHKKLRPDMPPNWKEKISPDFLKFVWTYRVAERPRVLALLEQYAAGRTVLIVPTPDEAERILKTI